MKQYLTSLIERLQAPSKNKYPTVFEIELREQLLKRLEFIAGLFTDEEIKAGIEEVLRWLSQKSCDCTYAFQRNISAIYKSAIFTSFPKGMVKRF